MLRLFLDVTRLHQRGRRSTPSGIDRVEYAYLTHALQAKGGIEPHFVIFDRFGEGVVRRARAEALHEAVTQTWQLDRPALQDPVFLALQRELAAPLRPDLGKPARFVAPEPAQTREGNLLSGASEMFRARGRLTRRLAHAAGESGVYLHTSHAKLDRDAIPRWLAATRLAPVFFLHDVIPLDFPEFCRPGERDRHLGRLRAMTSHASLVLANSLATAEAAAARLAANDLPAPDFAVVPLGVEACFRDRGALTPPVAAHPYAVVAGTIEPRKNLAFLLEVWRRLVERRGAAAPRLVIVGRRGWENESVVDYLERSERLAPFVIEASDLSDAGLAATMAGARIVLAPSFSEGFGLPVAEALSLGTPVVASDIPAHREIGQGLAELVDPIDGPGWARAIEAACDMTTRAMTPAYRALSWREHVEMSLGHIGEYLKRRGAERPARPTDAA